MLREAWCIYSRLGVRAPGTPQEYVGLNVGCAEPLADSVPNKQDSSGGSGNQTTLASLTGSSLLAYEKETLQY